MAAENALIYMGEIGSLTETLPSPVFIPQPSSADDFSADVVLPSKMRSKLLYDFTRSEEGQDDDVVGETEPVKSTDEPVINDCDDDFPEELHDFSDDDVLSQLVGKNPLTIIGEMQIEARYLINIYSTNYFYYCCCCSC